MKVNSMAEIDSDRIKADILHKLFRKKKWGGAHTALDKLHKWCPPEFAKDYKETANALIKNGFLLLKPTHYGPEISLNPAKRDEIISIVKRFFSDCF